MTEIYKSITGYPYYEVSNYGNVRSYLKMGNYKDRISETPRPITQWNSNGYPTVTLVDPNNTNKRRNFAVHILVAQEFLGERPKGTVVRHIDDNKLNNNINNLRYGTYSENGKDAVKNGKLKIGENSKLAKLSDKEVDTIRHLVVSLGKTHQSVADMFGVARSTISGIISSGKRQRE